jgi:hypothetical protein
MTDQAPAPGHGSEPPSPQEHPTAADDGATKPEGSGGNDSADKKEAKSLTTEGDHNATAAAHSPKNDPSSDAKDAEVDEDDEEDEDEEEEDEDEDEDDGEEEDEDDDEEDEPQLKYARLTQHLGAVYRNGDATSAFLVAGDKMVW